MSIFRSYKDDIIADQMRTIKRLNEELSMRIKYEEQLLCVISQFEQYEEEKRKQRQFELLDSYFSDKHLQENVKDKEDIDTERQHGFEEFMRLDKDEEDK